MATPADTPRSDSAWRSRAVLPVTLGLVTMIVAFLIGFWPSIRWMAGEWSAAAGVMSHGYLIVAISAVLFYRAIPAVATLEIRPAWWALLPLAGLSILWLVGHAATVVAAQTVILPFMLLAAIVAAVGLRAARPLAFPVLFTCFALPALEHLQFVFQAITVFVVGVLLRVTDLPAFVEGNLVQIPQGTFEIAGGCSGLSFVVAGASLAVLYGYLYYDRLGQVARLLAVTLAVAMVGNWLRVFGIIVVGYRSDMQSSLVDDHLTVGWVLFSILMIPVYFYARKIEAAPDSSESDTSATSTDNPVRINWTALIASVLAMSLGPLWAATIATSDMQQTGAELRFPDGVARWGGPRDSTWDWQPQFAGADIEKTGQYDRGADVVLVYANRYMSQRQDKELIYLHNSVAGDWRRGDNGGRDVSLMTEQGQQEYRQVVARNYIGNWIIWYRYQVGRRYEVSETGAKLMQAVETLRGRPEAGIIAFAAPCRGSCDKANDTLTDFVVNIGHSVTVDSTEDLQ